MTSSTDLVINLQRPNVAIVAYAVQGDALSRVLRLTLMDGDLPWTPPEGALAIVRYHKPDGTRGFYDTLEDGSAAISINSNVATVTLAAQALTAAGDVDIQLNFYTAAKAALSSFKWRLTVEAQVASDSDIESSDYYSALTETIAKAIELLPKIEAAGQYAEAAELAKDAAAASAAAALASQNAAAGSANTAGVAAQSASVSQQAAAASATAAGQAATSADASKTAAAGSATDAAQSEAAAEGSAEDAEAWAIGKRNGTDVPTTDPTHNNNAKYWAEQAKTAAGGGVLSINSKTPDDAGAVTLTAADVGAVAVDQIKIWISPDPTSPASLFGGTWTQIKDRFILAAGDTYAAGSTGGSAEEKITTAQMPEHFHEYGRGFISAASQISGTGNDGVSVNAGTYSPKESYRTKVTGGGEPHNNMPPYLSMYVWTRVTEEVAA